MNKSNTELQVEIGEAYVYFEWAESILKQLKTITEKEKDRNVQVFVDKTKTLNYHVHEFCKSVDLIVNPNGDGKGTEELRNKKLVKPIDQDQVKSLQNEEMKDGRMGKGAKNAPKKGVKSKSATGAEQAKEIGEFLTEAHADFSQSNLNGIQAKNVEGVRLPDGNFIFVWKDEGFKKLVLTDNQGDVLKAGYVRDAAPGWENPATWTPSGVEGRWGYTVTNFNGSANGTGSSGEDNLKNQSAGGNGGKTSESGSANQKDGENKGSSAEGDVENVDDGSIVLEDGTRITKDGSIVLKEGSTVGKDGSIVAKDGSVVLKEGSVAGSKSGSLSLQDGSTVEKDGSIVGKDGSIIGSGLSSQQVSNNVSFKNKESAKLLEQMGPEMVEYAYGVSEDKMNEFYSKERLYLWLIG